MIYLRIYDDFMYTLYKIDGQNITKPTTSM